MDELLQEFAEKADALESMASDDKLASLGALARRLYELETQIAGREAELKELNKQRYELRTKTIPELMIDIDVDVVGVPGAGVNVALTNECHANIGASWDDSKKIEAFEHLRAIGGGDLVKVALTVSAGRGSDEKMQHLTQRVRQILAELELDASISLEPSIPWNTLTKFVRETVEAGDVPVDLEKLGATYVSAAKIVKKKEK